jgi:hypothetical protein
MYPLPRYRLSNISIVESLNHRDFDTEHCTTLNRLKSHAHRLEKYETLLAIDLLIAQYPRICS